MGYYIEKMGEIGNVWLCIGKYTGVDKAAETAL